MVKQISGRPFHLIRAGENNNLKNNLYLLYRLAVLYIKHMVYTNHKISVADRLGASQKTSSDKEVVLGIFLIDGCSTGRGSLWLFCCCLFHCSRQLLICKRKILSLDKDHLFYLTSYSSYSSYKWIKVSNSFCLR